MVLPQKKFREIVFQFLYSQDIGQSLPEDMIPLLMKELSVTKKAVREALERWHHIKAKLKELDKVLAKIAVSYDFDRIQTVERNILRLGAYEILYDETIPPKVAISESIRLARKFGSPESAAFVNAILDGILKTSQGIKPDTEKMEIAAQNLKQRVEIEVDLSLHPDHINNDD